MDEGRMLKVEQVAERLQLAPETVRRWLRSGRLRGVRLGGTKAGYRIPESEVWRVLGRATPSASPRPEPSARVP